ncbi:MAG: GNAT family N-acetyltransferase [Marinobacter sp.]|nr:GNAT family N-acetyltransferase [Marinobacter sp.]
MSTTGAIRLKALTSITEVDEPVWNTWAGRDSPFVQYGFLAALEGSGCVSTETGWQPNHLLIYSDTQCIGAIPAYRKSHSMGEYVFDWAWADAWQRHGQPYYPKLLMAVPFSPVQGPRILVPDAARHRLSGSHLHRALDQYAGDEGLHSWHLLFPNAQDQALLAQPGRIERKGCQFHWFNRDYGSFEDFLALLTSRKRKSLRKERAVIDAQGIGFRWLTGAELTAQAMDQFYAFYQATYLKRGQQPYLNRQFYHLLRQTMADRTYLLFAEHNGTVVAGALFLVGGDTLYGRYWGCLQHYDKLHFETCYYQGIDLAIRLGLKRFDAGAQGEHKLIRGFEPMLTASWHWVANPGFQPAVARFAAEEAAQVMAYREAALAALPYRASTMG